MSNFVRRERFEAAYRELYAPICGYTLRRVRDPEDAAEVIAETFVTLWRRFDRCPQGEQLRPWLYGRCAACDRESAPGRTQAHRARRAARRELRPARLRGDRRGRGLDRARAGVRRPERVRPG